MTNAPTDTRVRLDKWLWAARFYKTRSQAAAAIKGGHVHVNGQRGKTSTRVLVNDQLRVTKGAVSFTVDVVALADKRGPARAAQKLYVETSQSIAARAEIAAQQRVVRARMPHHDKRPDKKQRRALRRFKQGR